jgi:hypothetical protein
LFVLGDGLGQTFGQLSLFFDKGDLALFDGIKPVDQGLDLAGRPCLPILSDGAGGDDQAGRKKTAPARAYLVRRGSHPTWSQNGRLARGRHADSVPAQ